MKPAIPTIIFLACFSSGLFAQKYIFHAQRYGLEEGLSHRRVTCITKDDRGFIWVGTQHGLNRFDGYRFRWWTTEEGLSNNSIRAVQKDAEGLLWVFSENPDRSSISVDLVNPQDGSVTPFSKKFPGKQPIAEANISAPCLLDDSPVNRESAGTLIMGSREPAGILRYHPATGLQFFPIKNGHTFYPLALSPDKTIWGIIDGNQLAEVDRFGRVLRRQTAMQVNSNGTVAVKSASETDLLLVTFQTGSGNSFMHTIDQAGNLGKTNLADFFKFPEKTNLGYERPVFVHRLPGLPLQLRNNRIVEDGSEHVVYDLTEVFPETRIDFEGASFSDRTGTLWIGGGRGLYRIEVRRNRFRQLLYRPGATEDLGVPVRGMLEKNGQIWVNTERNGQYVFDSKTGDVTNHFFETGSLYGITEDASGGVLTVAANALYRNGNLLYKLPAGIPGYLVWAILPDFEGKLLLGAYYNLFVFDESTQTGGLYDKINGFEALAAAEVIHIGLEKKKAAGQGKAAWLSTSKGLFRLVEGLGIQERYWTGGRGKNQLPADNLHHCYEDSEGILWLSTGGGGLLRLDRAAGKTTQFSRKNGFPCDVVYAAYEDNAGHLWIPSDQGIIRFDKKTAQTRSYTTADGITHNEFNRSAHARGADGTLYFGGLNGVTAFHPKDFYRQDASASLPLVLTKCQQLESGNSELTDRTLDVETSRQITVRPGDRYVQLEFSLLNYTPEQNLYAWRMEGLDDDWNYQADNILRPGYLPYGKHRLRIRGRGADGRWSERELVVGVQVLRPVWMRGWFLALAALALAGAALAFYRWRIARHRHEQERLEREVQNQTYQISAQNRQLERQAEDLKQLDAMKSRFFANVSHELRTPLTLILGPLGSMLKRQKLDATDQQLAQLAQVHSQQLLKQVNQLLDLSKLDAGRLELHETAVDLVFILQRLVAGFESYADSLGVRLSVQVAGGFWQRVQLDAAKLETIAANLITNALKFTPSGGSVLVLLEEKNTHLRLSVGDTGRGIHPDDLPHIFERFYQTGRAEASAEGGTGIGLALCRELGALLQGRLWAESPNPAAGDKGSCFYFEFPKKQVAFEAAEIDRTAPQVQQSEPPKPLPASRPQLPETSGLDDRPTVLVVEDNASLRDYLCLLLGEKYRVITAEHGQAALEQLAEAVAPSNAHCPPSPVSMIISDIMMPVMDGFQLLEKLKNDERWRHLPLIMLTARAESRDKLRALRIGVDDYVLKPFEEEELLVRVEGLLKNYQLRTAYAAAGKQDSPELGGRVPGPILPREDAEWLENLETLVLKQLGNTNLTAETLAGELAMSRAAFFRRTKQLTGLTPAQYLDAARFQAARRLLETRQVSTVKAAAYSVGFRQEKHFARRFRERFGKLPSDYLL